MNSQQYFKFVLRFANENYQGNVKKARVGLRTPTILEPILWGAKKVNPNVTNWKRCL